MQSVQRRVVQCLSAYAEVPFIPFSPVRDDVFTAIMGTELSAERTDMSGNARWTKPFFAEGLGAFCDCADCTEKGAVFQQAEQNEIFSSGDQDPFAFAVNSFLRADDGQIAAAINGADLGTGDWPAGRTLLGKDSRAVGLFLFLRLCGLVEFFIARILLDWSF